MIAVVTGAAGFVGSALAHRLLADGATVLGIDSLTKAYEVERKVANIESLTGDEHFKLFYADLLDTDLEAILDGADVVFHLAGQASVAPSWGSSFGDYARNNVETTQTLLEACTRVGVQRVVYASSSSVYGNAVTVPTPETVLPQPVSPYGVTKLAAEHLCRAYTLERGLPTTSLRLFTVYGPNQRPDMCFHKLCEAVVDQRPFTVNGDGSATRDFTYVDDIVDAFVRAADCGWNGVMNIGGGNSVSLSQVLDTMTALGGPIDITYGPAKPGDARDTSADVSLAGSVLGYRPTVSLEQGLEAMLAWAATSVRREVSVL
ncbi:MAG: galE1 [Acidimicrobiales bacterium]|nr:galE1 [Acidimicrobiales bacterium]